MIEIRYLENGNPALFFKGNDHEANLTKAASLSPQERLQWAGTNPQRQSWLEALSEFIRSNPTWSEPRPDLAVPDPPQPPTPEQLSGFRFAMLISPLYRAYMDGIAGQSPTLASGLQDAIMAGNLIATIALWNTIVNLSAPPANLIQELRNAASTHGIPFNFDDDGKITE